MQNRHSTVLILGTIAAFGCYESVLVDDNGAVVLNDNWPPDECTYAFHVTEEADPDGSEELQYEPVDDVDDYYVDFLNDLESIRVYGPHPFDSSEQIYSSESPLQPESTDEWKWYALDDFLIVGALTVWQGEADIMAQLDFIGSGVPVILSYRGYLTLFDCGPPVV